MHSSTVTRKESMPWKILIKMQTAFYFFQRGFSVIYLDYGKSFLQSFFRALIWSVRYDVDNETFSRNSFVYYYINKYWWTFWTAPSSPKLSYFYYENQLTNRTYSYLNNTFLLITQTQNKHQRTPPRDNCLHDLQIFVPVLGLVVPWYS